MRNAGMKKLWITSSDASVTLTGRPIGHVQFVDLALAVRILDLPHPLLAHHVNVHGVGRAELALAKKILAPHQKKVSMTRNGMMDQVISSRKEPWIGCGTSSPDGGGT